MFTVSYPSRPAPSPPIYQSYQELPADHPFLNPYTPSHPIRRSISTWSLDSEYSVHTTESPSPTRPLRISRPYTTSPASSTYSSSLSRSDRSPSSLSTPTRSSTKPTYTPTSPSFIPLPKDLAILDSRPRRNLLADIEYITGKKLHFPFLQKRQSSQEKVVAEKEKQQKVTSVRSEKSTPSRLTKIRRMSEEEECLFEITGMRQMREGRSKGRGVREGNWV